MFVVGAVLLGLSPLALDGLGGGPEYWERLSFIGQTYGAASALLAGAALIGVAATLVLQARETRLSRENALRESNAELLRMAMEDPVYAACWGENLTDAGGTAQRQSMYTNMILSQWEMAYESRSIDDGHLRALAARLFAGRVGWDFWADVREVRISTAASRRSRRFHAILDEEFAGRPRRPAAPTPAPDRPSAPARPPAPAALPTAAGAAAGLLAGLGAALLARRLEASRPRPRRRSSARRFLR
ncbi:DUF6082 family protein [Nocardiopsis potens]|uniref:DUF6082 family protein n=1 Tax=Nocardiopsis potens TaxID=1246458 RepID=UPI0003474F4A|nr:DUF6082 family protein [Nocardiopsis potens]